MLQYRTAQSATVPCGSVHPRPVRLNLEAAGLPRADGRVHPVKMVRRGQRVRYPTAAMRATVADSRCRVLVSAPTLSGIPRAGRESEIRAKGFVLVLGVEQAAAL
jgi:hypothetical protein